MVTDGKSPPAVFVMPHYSDTELHRGYLKTAVSGLRRQTDDNWRLVIVDDASPRTEDLEHLRELARTSNGRITVLPQARNQGAGICRNIGVSWAREQAAEIVLFNDADDVSHPRRLETVRRLFDADRDIDFIYSTFSVIDENDRPVSEDRIAPMIAEILESHRRHPVEGLNAWIRIGTETGYTTLTSTVAVRTSLAVAHPFPDVRGSEDSHTWLRMSAGGNAVKYVPEIPTLYRIPQFLKGSSNWNRVGRDYHLQKVMVDRDGFSRAIEIALGRGTVAARDVDDLWRRFYSRLAVTMRKEGQRGIADELDERAGADSPAEVPIGWTTDGP
jgi:Glycosyl transferase family 2